MANYSSSHKPTSLNLDLSPKYLTESQSFFLLNHEVNDKLGKAVPLAANSPMCDLQLPAGENYIIGTHYDAVNNETYAFHFNSNSVHFISRIDGNGICQIVYSGHCLDFSANPSRGIQDWRVALDTDYLCTKVPGGKLKRLIWTDGSDDSTPYSLDVESSIATNFFSTPFFDKCSDNGCEALQLCTPEPSGCLNAEFIPRTLQDIDKSNKLLDRGFQFMFRFIYYDGRASEWSDRSSLYFQDAKGCFDSSEGFSRCMRFWIPIGNPLVDKIEFAASEDGGTTWYLADTIEKYSSYTSASQYWYQRNLADGNYSADGCEVEYIFCNDKQRTPIDPLQISREFNPMPRGAQGLFRINSSLAFFNYIKGVCPIDKVQTDKFNIALNCVDDGTVTCDVEYSTVIVRGIIYNENFNRNGFIYRLNGDGGISDDVTDPAWFGIATFVLVGKTYQGYDQTFSGKTRGFICYIDGTGYFATSEQWLSSSGTNTKVGVLAGGSDAATATQYYRNVENDKIYYQEFTFKVPKGTKGFLRLASHHTTSGDQNTSTHVIGIIDNLSTYQGTTDLGSLDGDIKEIYFDTCNGDVTLDQAFVISDLYSHNASLFSGKTSSGYSGYITDKNNQPVEGAKIYRGGTFEAITDHNGFYVFYKYDGTSDAISLDIKVEQNCSDFATIATFATQSGEGEMAVKNYQITLDTYVTKFYTLVKVPVTDCDGNPIGGLRVSISGSKSKTTDAQTGEAHFKLRNYSTRAREVRAVVIDKGCFTLSCSNECNPCLPATELTLLDECFEFVPEKTLTPTTQINTKNLTLNKKGLKAGGRYAFGIVAEGDCGMLSAVNPVTISGTADGYGYLDIPKTQEKRKVSFCDFTFDANGIFLPSWVKRLKIVRSINLNPYNLQWVVDTVERTSDGKIKLTIQSLNDFNSDHNFKTNTIYKYLAGDRVEFIRNGDGKIFDTATYGVLNYLTLSPFNDEITSGVSSVDDANYFNQLLIFDDGKLENLTKGAVIEIQTPGVSTQEVTYFEMCVSLNVVDGNVSIPTGTFSTFDTFLVNRQINGFPAQFFEHRNPSDFWGNDNGLSDVGKPHFVNKYENQKRYPRNITIASPTQINYFGDLEKTLDGEGAIIAIGLRGNKIGLAICEIQPFLFQVSDDLIRMGSDGVIHAASPDQVISNPEISLRGDFGCTYEDIGSIFFGDAYALWVDAKHNNYIVHNYSSAQETGKSIDKGMVVTQAFSFFKKRTIQKENFNKTAANDLDKYRYSTGINKNTGVVYLTQKSLRMAGINNAQDPYTLPNTTIIYNPVNDNFLGFSSFTPEAYSVLNLNDVNGCNFITYLNSIAYVHPVIADKWNEFYGVACDMIAGITINQYPTKQKIGVSIEIQSDQMFFISRVTTDKVNFLSEVPPIKMVRNGNKWNCSFLSNINSRGGLYGNENGRGYYINILLIKDNSVDLRYNSIDNTKRISYCELDSVLTKFSLSEQSGFSENL